MTEHGAGDDAAAIANLLYRYAELVDLGDAAGVAALFEHAIKLHDDGTPRTHHLITNPLIEIDAHGARATARSYYTVVQQTARLPLQVIAAGRYHDELERVDGRWRFVKRDYFMDMRGDVSDHLKSVPPA